MTAPEVRALLADALQEASDGGGPYTKIGSGEAADRLIAALNKAGFEITKQVAPDGR